MRKIFSAIGRGLARFFKAIGRFIKRHKRLSVFLLILILGGAVALGLWARMQPSTPTAGFTVPDTTLLSRMDLKLTVTATGTLQSTSVQEVTSDLSYDIAAVHVAVGDAVEKGQLLCTLDASELDDAIADLREDISDAQAQDAKSLERLLTTLQEALAQRETNWIRNEENVQNAENAIEEARKAAGKTAGEQAVAQGAEKAVATDAATQSAQAELNRAQPAYDSAETARVVAQAEYEAALMSGDEVLIGEKESMRDKADAFAAEKKEALAQAQSAYDTAKRDAESSWRAAEESSTYDKAYNKAYKNADVSNLESAYESAVETRDNTYENDGKSIENAQQSYDDQAEKDSAKDLRSQLEDYLEQREELDIVAPAAGTVMDMTAEVGKTAGGSTGGTGNLGSSGTGSSTSGSALFTIENKDSLEIPVSVAEYDAVGMATGLSAIVTSDALEDEEWDAVVTAVSPKASGGYFTVTVQVTSPVGNLAVGMSATVDIITESRTDVYAVPYDAVVTNSAGQTVVYALESGGFGGGMPSGMDWGNMPEGELPEGFADGERPEGMPEGMPSFDGTARENRTDASAQAADTEESRIEIVVETGLETDYYIEISGDELRDGLAILNDPLGNNVTVSTSGAAAAGFGMFGGLGGGGEMPGGGQDRGGAMPNFSLPS
ncbi:MAG: HlyD family secretion protein [Oscillospiraceae bacterium]